jgi:hypothetical protein
VSLATRVAAPAVLAALLLAGTAEGAPHARGAPGQSARHTANAPVAAAPPREGSEGSGGLQRAPSAPPLTGAAGGQGTAGSEADAGASPQREVDPLVSNGLGSPLCAGALGQQELSSDTRANCETSGFVAAGSPTGNYGIDVHIDTGLFGVSEGGFLSVVQDLFVTPFWMALVWAVHALVVMLEWCFTIDLLDDTSVGLGSGLRAMQANLTEPLLASVLAVAAVVATYTGLIRRRVSDALGHTLLAGVMMVGGLWVTLDPSGTVGALGGWANQASLGTLAVSSRGSPAGAGRALADSMAALFASTVEVPWCYLEFGDVGWCRDPARLDPRLHAAALKIAAREIEQEHCDRAAALLMLCAPPGSRSARALEHSAQLLRAAKSNGAIFLALPANGPERNSINDESSLLRAMCQSSRATSCRGPMAAQAEFRTNGGTWKRVGGLLLILAGVLGMLLLFGFIALRLLGAAIFSLLYLLLAPAVVLAPALGESGRMLFRRWLQQLLSAVAAKLLFAFLLGVVLAVLAILAALQALGWWTQWLLMSAFWWSAYWRRHQALSVASGTVEGGSAHAARSPVKRAVDALSPARRLLAAASASTKRLTRAGADPERRMSLARAERAHARRDLQDQARRSLEPGDREAAARAQRLSQIQRAVSAKRTQLSRIERARAAALAEGDGRRVAELDQRAARVEGEIASDQEKSNSARKATDTSPAGRADRQARFLDQQARLHEGAREPTTGAGRDYAALAGLAGFGREEYERLDPGRQRLARLEVDRELALRREMRPAASEAAAAAEAKTGRRERRLARRALGGALERRMRAAGREMPASHSADPVSAWARQGRATERLPARESSVMRDAREVAMRRKRQLGQDRP